MADVEALLEVVAQREVEERALAAVRSIVVDSHPGRRAALRHELGYRDGELVCIVRRARPDRSR